ncbi:MAG: hypothetical protein JW749_11230 [Sedimentisphaerales bacterium]|nr:hypothetical protein [Sedimentisphaerales bacterium]
MNDENKNTSMGKWSVGLAVTSIILVSLLLFLLMRSVWFGSDSGESGLAFVGIIGMALYVSSYIISINSLAGIGLAIGAIKKTLWRQGRAGLLLNISLMIIALAFLLWFHISLLLRK